MLKEFYILILKNTNWARNLPPFLKKMDVMVLNRLIFKKILGFSEAQMNQEGFIKYVTDAQEAITMVKEGKGRMVFFTQSHKTTATKRSGVFFSLNATEVYLFSSKASYRIGY
ncbi:MAG: hypothetical protein KCCBMMGE_01440 [Candidatus Methanoperedenaceae archaeon GB37]|nr:MAG: hypothetical protein KCCBMMGE_01440 [Candidatus Methanoperedenaceae archaeon GB37]